MDGDERQIRDSHLESDSCAISFRERRWNDSHLQLSPGSSARYPPLMGRNVVGQGAPDRSFAGLMDHLTGFSRESASGADADSDFGATFRRNSKPDSEFIDGSLTNPSNGSRAMLPVTERKPGRAASRPDATALSYEKALQIHGRRRSPPPPPVARTTPTAQGQKAAASTREDAVASARKAAAPSKAVAGRLNTAAAPPKAGASSARSGERSDLRSHGSTKPPGTPPIQAGAGSHQAPAAPYVGAKANLAPGVQRKKTAGASSIAEPGDKTARRAPAHAGKARDTSKSRGSGKLPGKAHREVRKKTAAETFRSEPSRDRAAQFETLPKQIRPLESAIEVMESPSPKNQLELLQPFGPLDQRRTIVSVRLTEGEFACLRERAEESGISVSAYMRSCVVDADQLRAQVKRALAEMRSLSAPDSSEPGMVLSAAGHRTGEDSGWNAQGWFRLVLRPLVFLFGPLFPARRSA